MPVSSITVRLGKYSERCRHPKNSVWHAVPYVGLMGLADISASTPISAALSVDPFFNVIVRVG